MYSKKYFLTVRHLVICFIVIGITLFVSPVNATTPTPEPDPQDLCGWPDPTPGTDQTNQCCVLDFDNISGIADLEQQTDSWGCVDLWIAGKLCLSDLWTKGSTIVTSTLDEDVREQLSAEGEVCKSPGVPSHINVTNEDCICEMPEQGSSNDPISILCAQYIIGTQNIESDENDPILNNPLSSEDDTQVQGYRNRELLQNEEYVNCVDCFADKGYWSAIGCIQLENYQTFITQNVFGLVLGIAGFLALGCIIYASFMLQVSTGNAEKVNDARELVTSCIIGLIVIIFSVFILRVIGYDILRIPEFAPRALEGEACREEGEEIAKCADGLYCPRGDNATCQVEEEENTNNRCRIDGEQVRTCPDQFYCPEGDDAYCERERADRCREGDEIVSSCPSGQYCPESGTEAICVSQAGEGEECSGAEPNECAGGLSCELESRPSGDVRICK